MECRQMEREICSLFMKFLDSPSYKILSSSPEGCLTGLAPNKSCTIEIQFFALTAGPHDVQLTLGTNGAADSVTLLEGIGTE